MVAKPDKASRYAPRAATPPRSMTETLAPTVEDAPAPAPVSETRLRQLSARIPESMHKQIRQYLATYDITVQEFVRSAVIHELERTPAPPSE